jgi:hypothetical protein
MAFMDLEVTVESLRYAPAAVVDVKQPKSTVAFACLDNDAHFGPSILFVVGSDLIPEKATRKIWDWYT